MAFSLRFGLEMAFRRSMLRAFWPLLLCAAQENGTLQGFIAEEPLCGYSKRNIDEDPLRRHCLRQCILGDDGLVYPHFEEWEEYCRETAGTLWAMALRI